MILDPHLHPSIIRSLQDWLTDFERFFVIDVDDIETIPIIIKRPQVCDDDEEESDSQDGARKLCVPPLERWFDECPAVSICKPLAYRPIVLNITLVWRERLRHQDFPDSHAIFDGARQEFYRRPQGAYHDFVLVFQAHCVRLYVLRPRF